LSFDLLTPDGRSPEPGDRQRFRVALQQAQRFADQPEGWLVLHGPPGCGKTHLAVAIVNRRLAAGEAAIFCVVPDLLDHLRLTYGPESDVSYDELFEAIKGASLLALDDLGAHSSTPWAQEKLFQLLNHRYNARLATVITTNSRPDELDERLRSRLADPHLATVCLVQEWDPTLPGLVGDLALERLRGMSFAGFSLRQGEIDADRFENLREALRLARNFGQEPTGWLILFGRTGTGKTHLAAAIANELQGRGTQVCFITVPDLLDHLRAAYAPDSKLRYDRVFEAVRGAPVLILDDLGAQSSTPWAQEKLFQLFNYRYNARLPTVITTNLLIQDHEARLRSRMLDSGLCTAFAIEAPPFHLEARLAGNEPSGARPPRRRR
jgi:DNA replication protein DnaC